MQNITQSLVFLLSLVAFLLTPLTVVGQSVDSELTDPEPVIQVAPDKKNDERIQTRISDIFSKIESVNEIEVGVDAGVVVLSGNVANDIAARDALEIAIRTSGVVTVRDEINRTLDVQDNIQPMFESAAERLRSTYKALPLIIVALLVFSILSLLGGWLARWKAVWQKISPNVFLAEIIGQAVRLAFIIFGAIVALNLVGASSWIATILGGAGVVGIAIGFAVRDSLENYISSIMLSLRQPFRPQDHVVINEHQGIVVRLTSRATILMTLDGNHLRIPNSTVFKGVILNYSTNPERKFDFEVGVDADDDPIEAIRVGLEHMAQHDFVLTDPEPNAVIQQLGDSNIIIKFMGWVDQRQTDFGRARSLAMSTTKAVLEDKGFTLPEPIYRLRFDTAKPLEAALKLAASEPPKAQKKPSSDLKQTAGIDVTKDTHLENKVEEERLARLRDDLLSDSQSTE